MTSTILRSGNLITDPSRPRIERDPVLGLEQWVWCLDFTNPFCNPTDAATPAHNTVFTSLSRDLINPKAQSGGGVLRNAGGTITQAPGRGGLIFPAGDQNVTDFVEFTLASQDFSVNNDDYLVIVWDKQPLDGFNPADHPPILWDSPGNATAASVWTSGGVGGNQIRGAVGTGSNSMGTTAPTGLGQGAPRQIAFARQGISLSLFINGMLVDETSGAGIATLQPTLSVRTRLAGNHTATIYKTAGCKLGGAYDRPVAEIVRQDWAACMNKFV